MLDAKTFYGLGSVPGGREMQMKHWASLDENAQKKLEIDLAALDSETGQRGHGFAATRAAMDCELIARGPLHPGHADLLAHFAGERAHAASEQHATASKRGGGQ